MAPAAIWSSSEQELLQFPLTTFLHFYRNHGLLKYFNQPRWQTVQGGSHAYVKAFAKTFGGELRLSSPVQSVRRTSENKIAITVAGDAPPGRKGWRIEVGSLDAAGDAPKPAPLIVEIANAAISTSGDRFQRLEIGGKRYSHILDPRTGQPLTDHNLVTVIAHDGLTAGVSTACSVIGPEQGLKLVAEWKAAARFQRQPLAKVEITESPGWADWLLK